MKYMAEDDREFTWEISLDAVIKDMLSHPTYEHLSESDITTEMAETWLHDNANLIEEGWVLVSHPEPEDGPSWITSIEAFGER